MPQYIHIHCFSTPPSVGGGAGRAPVLARSRPSFLTEQQSHAAMCTEASVAAQNHAHVRLDLSAHPPAVSGEAASAITAWPEFHAGVCDGLSYADLGTFGRTWIAYNAPNSASYWFSGVLYGLGLAGEFRIIFRPKNVTTTGFHCVFHHYLHCRQPGIAVWHRYV